MKSFIAFAGGLTFVIVLSAMNRAPESEGWITIFDGKTFNGWKAAEHPETFTIADGAIVVFGNRAHLFYDGPIKNHDFKNFEFKAQVTGRVPVFFEAESVVKAKFSKYLVTEAIIEIADNLHGFLRRIGK